MFIYLYRLYYRVKGNVCFRDGLQAWLDSSAGMGVCEGGDIPDTLLYQAGSAQRVMLAEISGT